MQAVDLSAILNETFLVALKLAAPVLAVALVVGLIISVFQAMTQINESTLAFVPKLVAIGAALLFSASFMSATLLGFAHYVMDQLILVGAS